MPSASPRWISKTKLMTTPTANLPQAHQPVLLRETLAALAPHPGGRYIDATLGAGGHAEAILEASLPDGALLGMDVDPQAIELSNERLRKFGQRVRIVRNSYTFLLAAALDLSWDGVDGVLFDLGVSSMQLDTPRRGFSFKADAALDMRFDPNNPISAETLVNDLPESELAYILWRYGEERQSRQIARAICAARPLHTTLELAEVIHKTARKGKSRIDPSTRTFQALRIAVNEELQAVDYALPQAVQVLHPRGRLVVISFHSLEDRLVKQYFRREASDCICPPEQPVCTCGHKATLREITRKPVMATEDEIKNNPRARSARLRAAEKLGLA
jgi:16S rRNA (cytosine1402-N4)-methyltransferase